MELDILNPAKRGTIFDSHAHFDDESFNENRDELLSILPEYGVGAVINCGTNIESSKAVLKLAERFDYCYAAAGYHPQNLPQNYQLDFNALSALCEHKKVVAIGEIGLDYYWHSDNKPLQQKCFIKQTEFAMQKNLPVIVHDREAHADTLDILKSLKPKGVVHCFSGSAQMAEQIIGLGMYIGIGGVLTFKNAKKTIEVVKSVPIDKILLETDAPYLSPEPFRGKQNNSAYICYVARKVAEIKEISEDEVLSKAYDNAMTLFGI